MTNSKYQCSLLYSSKQITMKTIISIILLFILLHSCCPSADEIRQLEEQLEAKQDSIKGAQFYQHIFALYDSINIPKTWGLIKDTNKVLSFELTSPPNLVIMVDEIELNTKPFYRYLKCYKTYKDSVCFDTELFDSLSTFIYKPLKNNKAIWCVYKPQINYYHQLGIYKAFNRD